MFNIKNINHRNNGVVVILLVLLSIVFSSCSSDNNPTIPINISEKPIEAGPILFITGYRDSLKLYSMELDGTDAKELISFPDNYITSASWSPNGENIVFRVGYRGFEKHYDSMVYIMDKSCQNVNRLTTEYIHTDYYSGGSSPFVWSPDSRKIAYTKLWRPEASGYYDIFTYDLTTNTEKQISSDDEYIDHVYDWSNDGKHLLSYTNYGHSHRFCAFYNSTSGNMEKKIYPGDFGGTFYKFSDDDSKLLTDAYYDKHHRISIYDIEQNTNQVIIDDPYVRYYSIIDWSTTKEKIFIGKHYGQHYDNSSFALYKYAIYDLEGNVIQDIPHPFGDNTPFHIVSWRMD